MFFCFSVIPHITDAIQEWVERVANQSVSHDGVKPDVSCIIVCTSVFKDLQCAYTAL